MLKSTKFQQCNKEIYVHSMGIGKKIRRHFLTQVKWDFGVSIFLSWLFSSHKDVLLILPVCVSGIINWVLISSMAWKCYQLSQIIIPSVFYSCYRTRFLKALNVQSKWHLPFWIIVTIFSTLSATSARTNAAVFHPPWPQQSCIRSWLLNQVWKECR